MGGCRGKKVVLSFNPLALILGVVVLYLTHKNCFKTGQTMPKQSKQSEKEKPRKPHGFGVFELF